MNDRVIEGFAQRAGRSGCLLDMHKRVNTVAEALAELSTSTHLDLVD